MAKQQLKELKERWQEKKADFQRSDAVASMNARLLKEVEAKRDAVTQLKATAKATADQHRRDNEASEKREERMGQMCNAMKDYWEGQPGPGGGTWRPDRDGERSDGGGRGGWSTVAAGSEPGGAHAQLRAADTQRRDGWTGGVPLLTPRREGGGKDDPRPNTARWREEIGQKQISSPLPGGV